MHKLQFNKQKRNSQKDKRLSQLMRLSSAIIVSAAISGCAINNEFVSNGNESHAKIETKKEPEYAYRIDYRTNSCINSYSTNFKYCNPFNTMKTKSTLDYELDAKFNNSIYGSLLLPFEVKKHTTIKLYFSEINIATHTNHIYEINAPFIKNNDHLDESIIANKEDIKIKIDDITLGWIKNYNLSNLTGSKIDSSVPLDRLKTGMQMILYLYKYPNILSLNSDIKCTLDKSNSYTMHLSLDKIDNGNLISIISSAYKLNSTKCGYFFGNYALSLCDNGFSILKLARRKAF